MPQLDIWREIAGTLFKRTDEGDVFFPHGAFGPGYVVNTSQKEYAIAAFGRLCRTAIVALIVGVFCVAIFGWPGVIVLLAILIGIFAYQLLLFRSVLRGSPRSGRQLRLDDAHDAVAQRSSYGILFSSTLLYALATGLCTMLALGTLAESNLAGSLIFLTGLVVYGFLLISSSRTIWLKWRRRLDSGGPPL